MGYSLNPFTAARTMLTLVTHQYAMVITVVHFQVKLHHTLIATLDFYSDNI